MNYLAFDLEIARDLDRIPLAEFKPDEWEKVEVKYKDEWTVVNYESKYDRFLDAMGGIIKANTWRPIDNNDWKRFRPLGITCAAAYSSDGDLWNWCAQTASGKFTPQMSTYQCRRLVDILGDCVRNGYKILTWNGLGFDFDVLAEESGLYDECRDLAIGHVDMMFHFFCGKGYPLGLDAASKGMGLPGKPEGMDGAQAPQLWAGGKYHKVLEYCSLDVKNTLMLAEAVDLRGGIKWTSRSGNEMHWGCPKWATVQEAKTLPLPDNSWMTNPMNREQFYGWTEKG